jgi:hypothetical protein
LHRLSGSFVLGFHGCDQAVARDLLNGTDFVPSANDWDWLGSGIYFWETNPLRGLEFAKEWQARGKITEPAVVGAVIDLGFCLDLVSSTGIEAVRAAHDDFMAYAKEANKPAPKNRLGPDKLLRDLDCAVINHLHKVREAADLPAFDTVRAVFIEGNRIYDDAGFSSGPTFKSVFEINPASRAFFACRPLIAPLEATCWRRDRPHLT